MQDIVRSWRREIQLHLGYGEGVLLSEKLWEIIFSSLSKVD